MTTYSLKQYVHDEIREQEPKGCRHGRKVFRPVYRRHTLIVATGLTFQDAKTRRNASRMPLDIVPERAA